MKDPASRPAIADYDANVEAYDTVFIGFPIWWYTAPTIIKTFIEAYDFSGKIVVFFATSGGSDVMQATTDLMEVLNGKGKCAAELLEFFKTNDFAGEEVTGYHGTLAMCG